MHLGNSFQRTVVFIGYRDAAAPSGFACGGTGFLVEHEGSGYLVTARHVAAALDGGAFAIRLNKNDRATYLDGDSVNWYTLEDSTVDIAIIPLRLSPKDGFDSLYFPTSLFITRDVLENSPIDVGSFVYTVGLFHFIHGNNRNLPMVHTGNIAAIPPDDERVPVWDQASQSLQQVEAYLIESRAISGASGSPVFARAEITWRDLKLDNGRSIEVTLPEAKVMLLGLFSGAWFLPPDDALKGTVYARTTDKVPVGIGIVVPADKILEVLELPELKDLRARRQAAVAAEMTTVDAEREPATTAEPPPA